MSSTAARFDVIAIGNAIVDVMAPAAEEDIIRLGLAKGGMTLIDTARAHELYEAMGPAREISGGSAANTLAGLAALGAKCAFIGQVRSRTISSVKSSRMTSARAGSTSPLRRAAKTRPRRAA